jgi:hypothetical protein
MSERLIRRLTSLYATLASQSKSYDAEAVREAIDALGKTPSALTRPAVGDDVERVVNNAEWWNLLSDHERKSFVKDPAALRDAAFRAGAVAALSSLPDMQEVERLSLALKNARDWIAYQAPNDAPDRDLALADADAALKGRGERNE